MVQTLILNLSTEFLSKDGVHSQIEISDHYS